MRVANRKNNQLRDIKFEVGFNPFAEGSCLVKYGNTHVLCTATVEDKRNPKNPREDHRKFNDL